MRQESGTVKSGADTVGDSQGGSGQKLNKEAVLVGSLVQVQVPAGSRAYISAHGFWKRGNTAMFDIIIFNLDVGSYLHMTPEKALEKVEN